MKKFSELLKDIAAHILMLPLYFGFFFAFLLMIPCAMMSWAARRLGIQL